MDLLATEKNTPQPETPRPLCVLRAFFYFRVSRVPVVSGGLSGVYKEQVDYEHEHAHLRATPADLEEELVGEIERFSRFVAEETLRENLRLVF